MNFQNALLACSKEVSTVMPIRKRLPDKDLNKQVALQLYENGQFVVRGRTGKRNARLLLSA